MIISAKHKPEVRVRVGFSIYRRESNEIYLFEFHYYFEECCSWPDQWTMIDRTRLIRGENVGYIQWIKHILNLKKKTFTLSEAKRELAELGAADRRR